MAIIVNQLTKKYQQQTALNNISFSTKNGEIVGFLGPNGAGKTTTMKILTCFMPPTSGTATVCGFDVQTHSLEVRRRIGYLPEHNPLYLDLYVREHLEFAARIYQLGDNTKRRIDEMIALTGLEREQNKKVGQLSKGYRQRLGLAQAMIHDPEVLILDEPTSGLDPNQLVEIRQVIRKLGQKKTVLLSSHIMQEVQALCNRIVIINRGTLVADDTPDNLQHRATAQTVFIVEFAQEIDPKQLQEQLPQIAQITPVGTYKWQIAARNNADIRSDIFQWATTQQVALLTLQQETSSLEDIFRQLTAN